ncbi:MAG: hypothetical protein KGJ06_05370 [Pseudomonadota bacterium]|nr:hypothetical protein [Pseudomonadota bacterium]
MKKLLLPFALIGIAALGVWGFMEGRHEVAMEALREKPIDFPPRMVEENEQHLVSLSDADKLAGGIVVEEISPQAVPASALVWWGEKAWVYAETSPGKFLKTAVTIKKFEQGHYEVEGVSSPARIVTQGAQLLLSEEERGSIEVGEDDK